MKSKFNIDLLFGKSKKVAVKKLDIFKKAALLFNYNLEKDFKEFDQDQIQILREHSSKRNDGTYRLRRSDRLDILVNSIGRDNLKKTINVFNIDSEFVRLIQKVQKSREVNLADLTDEEFFYARHLSRMFPKKLPEDELKNAYQRRQFFQRFERITRNFAGREKELNQISDYVDWLPKSTFIGKISSRIKNIINWHDKPPMLIKGIGGIGKSTLVAKFILDHNSKRKGKKLPVVYIDFDLTGFSIHEPMNILIEALRQITVQAPSHRELINEISSQISEMIFYGGSSNINKAQTQFSSRNLVYNSIKELSSNYDVEISKLKDTPILVVFDSFEEMQYRATSSELFSFFAFVKEIAELVPRIRPIFVGRAEVEESFEDVEFKTLEIKDFDKISANALLKNLGVDDVRTRSFIYSNFGGNPLMLRLASDLAKKEAFDQEDIESIEGKKWEYLVKRILGHIHNDDVRKIAVPGMLVRAVSPEIIKQVLAGPTKLGNIDHKKAGIIYKELKKEVALISGSSSRNEFSFRQDLRMVCEEMILRNYPKESKKIRTNAIAYYAKYDTIKDKVKKQKFKAEYYFHLMKSGKIPKDLTLEEYTEFRGYLERSIIELPEDAQFFLKALNRRKAAKKTIQESSAIDWEYYMMGQIKDALNGELKYLEDLNEELKSKGRNKGTNNYFTEFRLFEALLYQRLDDLSSSNDIIYSALGNRNTTSNSSKRLTLEFQLLLMQNYEYEERYNEAIDISDSIRKNVKIIKDNNCLLKFELLDFRIKSRQTAEFLSWPFEKLSNRKFKKNKDFHDTKWEFIFDEINIKSIEFKQHHEVHEAYRSLKKELKNLIALEGYSYSTIRRFIKDITYAGKFNIVLRDFIFAKEILGGNLRNTKVKV